MSDTETIQKAIREGTTLEAGTYNVTASEPAPFQVKDKLGLTGVGKDKVVLQVAAGSGTSRVFEVSHGKPHLKGFTIRGQEKIALSDTVSGVALLSGDGLGVYCEDVGFKRLNFSLRGYDGYKQVICLNSCLLDGEYIGKTHGDAFGIVTRQIGGVIVHDTEFTRLGSIAAGGNNYNHCLYLSMQTPLALSGACKFSHHLDGRYVQIYQDAQLQAGRTANPAPGFWHIADAVFEKMDVQNVSIQTSPFRTANIERTSVASDYRCIEGRGDVIVRGGSLSGAGAGVYCMKDGIRVELDGVDTSGCALPVDRASAKNVNVVRK